MKILKLRFKNLNSLYGEWFIDFTDPEYVSNGIFALTGPTGAGKSTVLDAICLALYGSTPRLGKITKSENGIMSRQTGECYAEVVFESQTGRFCCHWEQRRARKCAEGDLQSQEHNIADADTCRLIETRKSLVPRVIEEKTGMDFNRFIRSMLLAQGSFDAFLKADIEQKSKILEQITDTEIYSKISQRVHERRREEGNKLNLLQAEKSGITILEPEQEKKIEQELNVKKKEETDLNDKLAKTKEAITWLNTVNKLKKEISSLSEKADKLQDDIDDFKPEREKLERARKASSLDGLYAKLTTIREQQLNDQKVLKAEEKPLPELKSSVKEHAESLKLAERQVIETKKELRNAEPLIQKILSLDQRLTDQKNTIDERKNTCEEYEVKIKNNKQDVLKEREKRTEVEEKLKLANSYLKKYSQDEWLISGLAGVEEQLGSLCSRQKEINNREADYKKAKTVLDRAIKELEECTKQYRKRKQKQENISKYLQQEKNILSKLLNKSKLLSNHLLHKYYTKKKGLLCKMVFLSKLEEYRDKPRDDNPCPLCGAKEHLFLKGDISIPDETEKEIKELTELIAKSVDQEASIKKLEKTEVVTRKNLTDSEKLEAIAANGKKVAEKVLSEKKDSLEKVRDDFTELKQDVSNKLRMLGILEIPDDVSLLLESLEKRLEEWQLQSSKKTETERQIAKLDSEVKSLDAVIKNQNDHLSEEKETLKVLKKKHAAESDEREELYGDKNPASEQIRLKKAVDDAEKIEKKTRKLHDGSQQELNTANTRVESLKRQINQRHPELKDAESDFTETLARVNFSDEKEFLEARLTTEQQDALSAKAEKLHNRQIDIKIRKEDREKFLDSEINKNVTGKTFEELEPQLEEDEKFLSQLRDEIAGLRHKLSENKAAKDREKEKRAAIDAQEKECNRWNKLHSLIGSADGKKYRNFAQGLTFELMVSHTNRQLGKMTDRYLLILDDERPLELNVIDNYQAGEIRSTKNLSGGESFIVSLALALGLSKMASRKVRVDSLFLDEGFGTLDEESLETALETLSGLQQEDKLIGIISHVSALKERINTQITVTPVSGGRSSLAGPGCKKVQ